MSAKKRVKIKTKSKPKVNYKPYFVHYFYCLSIITLLILASLNLNRYINNQKVLGASIDVSPIQNEKAYWESIISESPTYTDAYLQLAKINVELGNKDEAITLIQVALARDPNSPRIIEVQHQLGL